MVLTTLLLIMRRASTSADFITVDDFVDTFTEILISWNSRNAGSLGRGRRSSDSSLSKQQSEYVNVDCNLVCRTEANAAGNDRRALVCVPKSKDIQPKGTLVRTMCVEHASGSLLHMIISIPNNSADYLDWGFAEAVSKALREMSPEPAILYLTIEIPLLILRQNDFAALAPKLRRLSVYLGQAIHIDRNVLSTLSLESYSLEGCVFKDTRVFRNNSGFCDVNMFYTCPKIGDFVLAADKTGWKKLCPEKSDTLPLKAHPETTPTCACGADYKSLLEALHLSNKLISQPRCALDSNLFIISLTANLILCCILLVITLFAATLYVQNNRRSHREKA